MYQAGELPKTFGVSKIDHEPPKTVCKTIFASSFPPSKENGDGTRPCGEAPVDLQRFTDDWAQEQNMPTGFHLAGTVEMGRILIQLHENH